MINDQNYNRRYVIAAIAIGIVVVFIIRLFFLQVVDNTARDKADNMSLLRQTVYAPRGLIYDRNGELLVYNQPIYEITMVYREMGQRFDTAAFCYALRIRRDYFIQRTREVADRSKNPGFSRDVPQIFMTQLAAEDIAPLRESLDKFPGIGIRKRTLRDYPYASGAQVLGSIGEVNKRDIERDDYYQSGDYSGREGIERTYEEVLRGEKGVEVLLRDNKGRIQGHYRNGELDTMPVEGCNLYTTLDADLQAYAEELMANKRGCVVAIEPSTGEVLAMVSAPTYDPNLLVGRIRGKNYLLLNSDLGKPMLNRALMGQYPPGSIFKVAQAMTALDLGVITPGTGFVCDKHPGCHNHPSARSVREAIKMSCNPYFYQVYRRVIQQGKYRSNTKDSRYGLTVWREYMLRFGFGQKLDIDLPKTGMSSGTIPDTAYYDRWYGRDGWAFSTIYSNSIGQGEVTVVPIQMANLAAIVANHGWYITPHVVRFYGADSIQDEKYKIHHETGIKKEYFDIAADGMYDVVHVAGGTARRARVDGLDICGKTGTAENYGNDHSVFIAFAPKNNPKIALAVYVENAQGGGGTWAAPIAGLIIEKYLNGEVKRKDVEKMYKERQEYYHNI